MSEGTEAECEYVMQLPPYTVEVHGHTQILSYEMEYDMLNAGRGENAPWCFIVGVAQLFPLYESMQSFQPSSKEFQQIAAAIPCDHHVMLHSAHVMPSPA